MKRVHPSDIVPPELLTYWLEGRYLIGGGRSRDYENLGWSLMIRGLYNYYVCDGDDEESLTHWGYCVADVTGNELYLGGIRLWTNESSPELQGKTHPLYWRSDFTNLRPGPDGWTLTFVYRLIKLTSGQCEDITKAQNSSLLSGEGLAGPDSLRDKNSTRLTRDLEGHALDYLCDHFDDDWPTFSQSSEFALGMVHIPLKRPEGGERLGLDGEYAAVGLENVTGGIHFRRVERQD